MRLLFSAALLIVLLQYLAAAQLVSTSLAETPDNNINIGESATFSVEYVVPEWTGMLSVFIPSSSSFNVTATRVISQGSHVSTAASDIVLDHDGAVIFFGLTSNSPADAVTDSADVIIIQFDVVVLDDTSVADGATIVPTAVASFNDASSGSITNTTFSFELLVADVQLTSLSLTDQSGTRFDAGDAVRKCVIAMVIFIIIAVLMNSFASSPSSSSSGSVQPHLRFGILTKLCSGIRPQHTRHLQLVYERFLCFIQRLRSLCHGVHPRQRPECDCSIGVLDEYSTCCHWIRNHSLQHCDSQSKFISMHCHD